MERIKLIIFFRWTKACLDPTFLVLFGLFTCSQGGEVLWSSKGLAPLVFLCVWSCSYLFLSLCVRSYICLLSFFCVQVLGAKISKTKCMEKLFQVNNVMTWPSSSNVLLLIHVFLKVLKFYEVLGVLHLLFSCVCVFFLFVLVFVCDLVLISCCFYVCRLLELGSVELDVQQSS